MRSRAATLVLLTATASCQALLVFDANETNVVVVGPESDSGTLGADGGADGSSQTTDAQAPSFDAASAGDPCAPPDAGTTLVVCDRFDDASAKSWTSESVPSSATLAIDFDASVPGPGGSLHVATTMDGDRAAIEYVFSAIKPTKLRIEFDFWLSSFAHGMAITDMSFGTYDVRVVVTDSSFFGYDEYDQNKPGSDFGQLDGVASAGPAWSHVALEVVTDAVTLQSAKLWVNGALAVEGALHPSDSTTQSITVAFGTVDRATADMHIDNVRITRSP